MSIPRQVIGKLLSIDQFILNSLPADGLETRCGVWFRDFIMSDYSLPKVADTDVVFFRSMARDDYRDSFHSVIRASGVPDPVIVENYQTRFQPARLNHRASRFMLENQALFDQIDEPDAVKRKILFIRLCLYAYILDHFKKAKPRAVVFFADMQPVEYLLSWYFRSIGVKTVTMQHGLYVDYGSHDTINTINYMHQPSEYFLSWGPETSDLIARYQPDTTVVECGKPLIFNAHPPEGKKRDRPYVALLLDQKPFHKQNEELIEIAQAYALRKGLDVCVRFHPSLPKAEIIKKYPGMTEQLHFTDAQLVIGHTSSMVYEALALGCRVMRYASDIPAIRLPDNSEFRTLKELEARMALPKPDNLSRRYFTAIGDESLKNYRSFFDGLLNTAENQPVQRIS